MILSKPSLLFLCYTKVAFLRNFHKAIRSHIQFSYAVNKASFLASLSFSPSHQQVQLNTNTAETDTATGQDTCQTSEVPRYNNKTQSARISAGNSQERSQSREEVDSKCLIVYEANKQRSQNLVLE